MRASKPKTRIVRLAVDQSEVRADAAVVVIVSLATERVIEIAARQWYALRQHGDDFEQVGIEARASIRQRVSARARTNRCMDFIPQRVSNRARPTNVT
jgi:hypothetical protein